MYPVTIRLWHGLVLLMILMGTVGAVNVFGEEPDTEFYPPAPNPMNVAADILILRPVGLIMIPVAGLVYAIGYPFAKAAGNEQEVYQSLLGATIHFTFHRPVGRGDPFEPRF